MKKLVTLILIVSMLALAGCSSPMNIDGKVAKPYGLLNKDDVRRPNVEYQPCWGNIALGSLTFYTVIGPIYFFGFDMYEPIGKK